MRLDLQQAKRGMGKSARRVFFWICVQQKNTVGRETFLVLIQEMLNCTGRGFGRTGMQVQNGSSSLRSSTTGMV